MRLRVRERGKDRRSRPVMEASASSAPMSKIGGREGWIGE